MYTMTDIHQDKTFSLNSKLLYLIIAEVYRGKQMSKVMLFETWKGQLLSCEMDSSICPMETVRASEHAMNFRNIQTSWYDLLF